LRPQILGFLKQNMREAVDFNSAVAALIEVTGDSQA
jgi:hypothetical protein